MRRCSFKQRRQVFKKAEEHYVTGNAHPKPSSGRLTAQHNTQGIIHQGTGDKHSQKSYAPVSIKEITGS
jgi:hypothetical protein